MAVISDKRGNVLWQTNAPSLKGADFIGADLRDAIVFCGDLSMAMFQDTDLRGAEFLACNMTGAMFSRVNAVGADFTSSTLCNATFDDSDLTSSAFIRSDLSQATFQDCNTTNADFTNATSDGMPFSFPTLYDWCTDSLDFFAPETPVKEDTRIGINDKIEPELMKKRIRDWT